MGNLFTRCFSCFSPSEVEGRTPLQLHQSMQTTERCLIIGDVHGCADELKQLVAESGLSDSDDVLLVGDLVAKGPKNADVIQFCLDRRIRSVCGNHDHLVLRYADAKKLLPHHKTSRLAQLNKLHKDDEKNQVDYTTLARLESRSSWPLKGADSQHAQIADQLTDSQLAYLATMPLSLTLTNHATILVHAGLLPQLPLSAQHPDDLMNMRNIFDNELKATGDPEAQQSHAWIQSYRPEFVANQDKQPQFVCFGHDAKRGLQQSQYAVGLDTGCCYGNALTGLLLPERRIISVKAKHQYMQPDV